MIDTAPRSSPRRMRLNLCALTFGTFALCCNDDLERFDTGETGAFCGNVVQGQFVRSGFSEGLRMRLTLDIPNLNTEPGTLTLEDELGSPCDSQPTYDNAKLHVTPAVFADAFSELQFGTAREHNFTAWVDSDCAPSSLAVVSLMHDGGVEVRLLRRDPAQSDSGSFAVFQLNRTSCED